MRRLLVTRASGTLGRHVARVATQQGWKVCGTFYTSPPPLPGQWLQLDVSNRKVAMAVMREIQPTAVVQTAFRQYGEAIWAKTAQGAAFVAHSTQALGVRLIHVASDAIFDGTSNPYPEVARPNPCTLYGAAKAAAEMAVSAIAPQAAIVRTSLIISREPLDPHTRFILDLAAGRNTRYLFSDQYRCPIGVDDLARAILEVAGGTFEGVINDAGADVVSRYVLGRRVARAHHVEASLLKAGTIPMQMACTRLDVNTQPQLPALLSVCSSSSIALQIGRGQVVHAEGERDLAAMM